MKAASRPRWWGPLWAFCVISLIVYGLFSYFYLHLPLQHVFEIAAVTFALLGVAYYVRVKPSIRINRALYILLGISPIGLGLSAFYAFIFGAYAVKYLGVWSHFIILFTVPYVIGAFIGDWIGKKRDYRLPLSP
jgi:hypothetical protein